MSVYDPDGPAVPDEDAPVRRFGERRTDPLQALQAARDAAGSAAGGRELELEWISEDDLGAALADVEQEARPLWCPEPQISQASIDSSRAVAAGLRFRPALQTARETLAWWSSEGGQRSLRAGLPPAVEAQLLAAG